MTDRAAIAASPVGELADYLALLKPRVMSLVLFTALVGFYLAPGELHPVLALTAFLCIAAGAGAAAAINMWYDRDIDALMARTRERPIPAGRVEPGAALVLGAMLGVGSVTTMALAVNAVAAALLALTIVFYIGVYTMWLKRRTAQNIVIGGAAGALPPMIGWAAASGGIAPMAIALFLIVLLWTPPHFWALAIDRRDDYARAGVPMLPVVAGIEATKWQMLAYTLVLLPVALAPTMMGSAGPIYGIGAAVLGVLFVASAVRVLGDGDRGACRRMFGFSIVYLFALFALLVVDKGLGAVI